MKEKLPLIISVLIILCGVVKFDIFIYPTLDYFGKFVMLGMFNIFPFWIANMLFKISNIKLKYISTVLWGVMSGGGLFMLVNS